MKGRRFVIGTSLGDGAGGDYYRALGHELVNRGHQVTFLVWGNGSIVEDLSGNPSTQVWPSSRPTGVRDMVFIFKIILKYRPQCLIANFGAVNLMMVVGWLMRVPCRIAWYRTLSSQIQADTVTRHYRTTLLLVRKRLVYGMCTRIVANSRAAAEDLRKVYRVPVDKCIVFHNLLRDPCPDFGCNGLLRRKDWIVCVGRLFRSKGQSTLIRAVAELRKESRHLHVLFIGDGPSKQECMRLAHDLSVEEDCKFIGWASHSDVLRHMSAAVATVVPSQSEAFGWVTIESMAVSTPVVAAQVGGIPEIVRDGLEGYLFPASDYQDLARKLATLLDDAELCERLGKQARERFLATFELLRQVSNHADSLERLAEETPEAAERQDEHEWS